jgi:deoxycytidylate deaminase
MKEQLLRNLYNLESWAVKETTCLRKGVGCAIIRLTEHWIDTLTVTFNGPSRKGAVCTNEVGNCGCSHAEPRAIQTLLGRYGEGCSNHYWMLCTYSPCTTCANIIIDSGLFSEGGVIYHYLTNHDVRGDEFLRAVMPVVTAKEIERDGYAAIRRAELSCPDAE